MDARLQAGEGDAGHQPPVPTCISHEFLVSAPLPHPAPRAPNAGVPQARHVHTALYVAVRATPSEMKIAAKALELEGPALHDSEACSVHCARLLEVPAGAPAAASLVALKLIKISNNAAFDRFERERAVLQRADHPCIVKPLFIIEVRVSDGASPRVPSWPDALLELKSCLARLGLFHMI